VPAEDPVTDELIAEFVDAVRGIIMSDDGVPVLFGLGPDSADFRAESHLRRTTD
jgi:hypothetical protein